MKSFAFVLALVLPIFASAFVFPRVNTATCSSAESFCCSQVVQLSSSWDAFLHAEDITVNTTQTHNMGTGCAPKGSGTCYSGSVSTCCSGETFHGPMGGSYFPTNCTLMGSVPATGKPPVVSNIPAMGNTTVTGNSTITGSSAVPISTPLPGNSTVISNNTTPTGTTRPGNSTVTAISSLLPTSTTAPAPTSTPLQSNNTVGTDGQL